jgi:hypothetical protein
LFERQTFQQLYCDEGLTLRLIDIVDGANIRMIKRRSRLRFPPESLQSALIAGYIFRKKLDSDIAFEPEVFCSRAVGIRVKFGFRLPQRRMMMKVTWPVIVLLIIPICALAQQMSDDSFQFDNPNPAFSPGKGPKVCIDEAHFNFHTGEGRYKPFAKMLREDGYRVVGFAKTLTQKSLGDCQLLVISNALAKDNSENWAYPHHSAFTRNEIRELKNWIIDGGSLLLIADHAPFAGAAKDLGSVLGIAMVDAYADGNPGGDDVFRIADGTLKSHAITRGRSSDENVNTVVTFTGQAAHITEDWEQMMVFGPAAIAVINPQQTFQIQSSAGGNPSFSAAGLTHAATRLLAKGRVVFLGEAAMCTAQVAGPERTKMGMNNPIAKQNAQFCVNVVHWLTKVIDK